MGSCVSVPTARRGGGRGGDILKPVVAPEFDHGRLISHSGNILRQISIIEDPTGDNVYAKYRFEKELGRGEFGITYRCVAINNGEAFACKTISKSKLRTEVDVEDVRREVQIMSHLPEHPHIVAFKEAYEDKEAIYLVMELCEGGELFDRIVSRGHYTERAAARITRTILDVCKVIFLLVCLFYFCFPCWEFFFNLLCPGLILGHSENYI